MSDRIKPFLILVAGFLIGLSACAYLPQTVAGVPTSGGWFSLPLSEWLAEDRGQPLALSACAECGKGLAVSAVRLTGSQADDAERVLRSPQRLAASLSRSRGKRAAIVQVHPLDSPGSNGFILTMAPADGSKAAIIGAATGRRTDKGFEVIIVIGGDEAGVLELLRSVSANAIRS